MASVPLTLIKSTKSWNFQQNEHFRKFLLLTCWQWLIKWNLITLYTLYLYRVSEILLKIAINFIILTKNLKRINWNVMRGFILVHKNWTQWMVRNNTHYGNKNMYIIRLQQNVLGKSLFVLIPYITWSNRKNN
jgi:hypothetical protein